MAKQSADITEKVESIDGKMAEILKVIESDKFEKDMNHLVNIKETKGKSASVFALKDMIIGKKKSPLEPVVLIDPETGGEVNTPSDIKRVSLKYCVNLLKKNRPKSRFSAILKAKKETHFERMSEAIEDDIEELPLEVFQKTFENMAKKHGNKYRFIINAGYSLKLALFHLFRCVWKSEKVPKSWHESTVIQIQKGKSNNKDLDNIRHLHDCDQF